MNAATSSSTRRARRPAIDLKELVDEVRERGIGLPLLIRFSEILKAGWSS